MPLTIEQLIVRVEQRLMLAAGLDVQIHAEDTFVEMARHTYNVTVDEIWLDDYMEIMSPLTLSGTDGTVTETIEDNLKHFKDVRAVYYDNDTIPLPRLMYTTNPTQIRRMCLKPIALTSPLVAKVFQVYPFETTGPVHVIHRTRLADDAWEANDPLMVIPMDDELMVLGTTFDYLSSDASNIDDAKKVQAMYTNRMQQLQRNEFNVPLSKRPQDTSMHPNYWEEGP